MSTKKVLTRKDPGVAGLLSFFLLFGGAVL